jgi:hypothetical protein
MDYRKPLHIMVIGLQNGLPERSDQLSTVFGSQSLYAVLDKRLQLHNPHRLFARWDRQHRRCQRRDQQQNKECMFAKWFKANSCMSTSTHIPMCRIQFSQETRDDA